MQFGQGYGQPTQLFQGTAQADIDEGGNYLGLGIYDLRVHRCLVRNTRLRGLAFIAELEVLSSTNPEQPTGCQVTFFQSMQEQEIADRAIKAFAAALLGFDATDKNRIAQELNPHIVKLLNDAIGPQNIFAGKCVHAETYKKITKRNQKEIILPRWSPFEGEAPAFTPPQPAPVQAQKPAAPTFGAPPAPGGYARAGYTPPAHPHGVNYGAPPAQPAPAPYAPPAPAPAAAPYWNGTTWVMP